MTDTYDGKEDGRRGHDDAIRHLRAKGLREGRFTPRNDEERAIAEGRDMTIEEVIAAGLDVPREPGKPGPSDMYWPKIWPIIVRAAFEGGPCPRNIDIAEQAGSPFEATASKTLLRAQKRGVLRIERRGNVRRIVLHTGHATGWSVRADVPGRLDSARHAFTLRRREGRERRRQQVLDILADCARTSAPPPTNQDIAARLGCGVKTVMLAIHALIADGRLIQHGHALGRSFVIPGVGTAARPAKAKAAPKARKPREPKAKARKAPKARNPKANWYMLPATKKDAAFHNAMHAKATRVDAVDVPATADDDRAAMLARFIARGGKPMRCPDGFAAVRPIHEVMA